MIFLNKLFFLLTRRDKQLLIGLLIFSILISIIETVGISIIMPFIHVATDFSIIETNKYFKWVYETFLFSEKSTFVISFGIVLILFYLFRSLINYTYFYALARYAQGRYHFLASSLFKRYLKMPYKNFTQYNSSMLSKSIISEAQLLTTVITALLMILSEVFVVIFIYVVMILVDANITFFLTVLLSMNALFMIKIISPKIKEAGVNRATYQQEFYEIINKSFGNYKMIKLHALERKLHSEFQIASSLFMQSRIKNQALSHFPRLFLEAIAFSIIIAIVIYFIWKSNGDPAGAIIAQISIFVLALYRLMPSVNRILTAYNQILFNYKSLDIIYHDMHYPNEELGTDLISFSSSIEMKNVQFGYSENSIVLNDVSLLIEKNEKIALVGESGSGKSTLVDLIIGLHGASSGTISIDNIELTNENLASWRDKIGYIPQIPYLFDGTVGENISFGLEYDKEKVESCLKQAQVYEVFRQKNGLKTMIGENGITLSGGQRQRIAIARALYKNPEVLVLDEATSALDYDTEEKIMREIYAISKDKTLIIIAHRLSTVQNCDRVIELKNGKILDIKHIDKEK